MVDGHISISMSSTFLVRSRCRECRSGPVYCYQDGPLKIYDIPTMFAEWERRKKLGVRANIQRSIEPFAYKLSGNSYTLTENKISVDSHRAFGLSDGAYIYLCACGYTMWAQAESSKAHTALRRAAKRYPRALTINITQF